MSYILGLDISTANVGWCILRKCDYTFVDAGAISMAKVKCVFNKATAVRQCFHALNEQYPDLSDIIIEENLQAFRPGFSSAKTIVTLARFNGMVTLIAFDVFQLRPQFMNVNSARKSAGLKINRKSDASTKEQVFNFVKDRLPEYEWPTRMLKSGPRKGLVLFADSCYDISDAYIIARSCIQNE